MATSISRRRLPTALPLLTLLWICAVLEPGKACDRVSVSGYFKNFSVFIQDPEITGPFSGLGSGHGLFNNRLRVNLACDLNRWSSFSVSYDLAPRIQTRATLEQVFGLEGFHRSTYRVTDFRARLLPRDETSERRVALFHNLDRAFATFKLPRADIYVGRQAIAWGSARAVNPTDILAPFAFNELDVEDRVGVDAVRLRLPIGALGEIDAGYVAGHHFARDRSALFLRGRWNQWQTDWSLLAAGFQDNLMLGVDVARGLGGAGVWFEGAYVWAGAFDSGHQPGDTDYFRGSWGVDYSLKSGTYLYLEYHFSQAGDSDPARHLDRLGDVAFSEGAVFLLGRHYLAPGMSYQLTPLLNLQAGALVNLQEGSVFLAPQIEYNAGRDLYLSAGAYIGVGPGPVFSVTPLRLALRSEFGSYPDLYFASVRVYF